MVSGRLLWYFFNRHYVYNARVKFHDEVDYIAVLVPDKDDPYAELDKCITRELTIQTETGDSLFRKFDLIANDSGLILYKHK